VVILKVNSIGKAVTILKQGGIIAYPTEGVYGLGCDPFNEQAVLRLLKLKRRSVDKGLILIASRWEQLENLVKPIAGKLLAKAKATWPGPVTWVFPATNKVPVWIRGAHNSVAIRVTNHPVAYALCNAFGGPIVSTSANVEGHPVTRTSEEVHKQFPQGIDFIVSGRVGDLKSPTMIRDVLTGKVLRL
jgi:L-threonylcarbamoyladenylate synthase